MNYHVFAYPKIMKFSCRIIFCLLLLALLGADGQAQQGLWQWLSPLPQGNPLNGMWAFNQTTALAVGANGTVIKTTNGGLTWQVEFNVAGVTGQLLGTQFVSASTGWAVGEGGTVLKTSDAGETWYLQNISTANDLYAVDFISPDTGWVAGLNGVVFGTTDGGSNWIPETTGTNANLYSLQFVNSRVGWVSGAAGTILRTTDGGRSWLGLFPNTKRPLFSLSFVTDSVGWAAGTLGTILKTTDAGITWKSVGSDSVVSVYAIQFVSKLVGWAVGGVGMIRKTTDGGSTWVIQPSGTYNDIYGIRFVSPTTGWLVGDAGFILSTTNAGTSWNQQSTNIKDDLYDVYFSSTSTGWEVGDEGTIVKTTDGGLSWTAQASNFDLPMYGVYFLDDLNGWVVGDSGVILRTTNGGANWVLQISHTDDLDFPTLRSVYFVSSTKGWVVGDAGTLLRTINGGTTWTVVNITSSSDLQRVKFFDGNNGWAVGSQGTILHSTNGGVTWVEQNSGSTTDLYSLEVLNTNHVVAVGDFSTILTTVNGGAAWLADDFDVGESLYDVSFFSSSIGWIVGDEGTILATTDGGNYWSQQASGSGAAMLSVQVVKSSSGGLIFAQGEGSTLLASIIAPLGLRTWTGSVDTLWTNPANWSPVGVPGRLDSVIISAAANNPVFNGVQQQLGLASLRIGPGAKCTLGPGLSQLNVSNDVHVDGVLALLGNAATQIQVGGSFLVGPGGSFVAGGSTVDFTGTGSVRGVFCNVLIAQNAVVQTAGNVVIKNSLTALSAPTLRPVDTLTTQNPVADAFQVYGTTGPGTIKRAILQGSTDAYQFESYATFVQFNGMGTYPDTLAVTTYPDSLPPDFSDTVFVRRFYTFQAHGGHGYSAIVSLRYDTSETSMSPYDVAFFRDTSGVLLNLGADDYLDSDMEAVILDSAKQFTTWYLGSLDYSPIVPFAFTTPLIVADNGHGIDTLQFGAAFGATSGIDSAMGEVPLGPKPPRGMFDARWRIPSGVTTSVDIRNLVNFVGPQNIYTCEFQPGVGGYPVKLSWDSTTFPLGKVFLQDSLTAGKKFSVNMKTRSTFRITDTSVSVFQVVHSAPTYYPVVSGWNMISVPLLPTTSLKKAYMFPGANSNAYGYNRGYYIADTLRVGTGYWLKFPKTQNVGIEGDSLLNDTISVLNGWNMIGSISRTVSIANVGQIPPGIIGGKYFGYVKGYVIADSLRPGQGYWIKTIGGGKLVLASSSVNQPLGKERPSHILDSFNSFSVSDNDGGGQTLYFGRVHDPNFTPSSYELPPPPPAGIFDARFQSQQLVERLPDDDGSSTMVVSVQSSKFPIVLHWRVVQEGIQSIVLTNPINGKVYGSQNFPRDGSIRIEDPKVQRILLTIKTGEIAPREFALRQNFPNPFNPSTTIQFDVPVQALVTVNIYNILGQRVVSPVSARQYAPGSYSVVWNGANFASGVYFYQLIAKDSETGSVRFLQVKKLVLLK
ncbi:MAG: YCF48-related protein [Bacteroidota bacterium]